MSEAKKTGWLYYVTDTFDGEVKGTNDESVAVAFSLCEEYFVVCAATGEWLQATGNRVPVREIASAA